MFPAREKQRLSALKLPVLLYHHVGRPAPGSWPLLTVSARDFERQVRWLRRLGYRSIRAADCAGWLRGTTSLPKRPVLLTFDDAYQDLTSTALPVLREYGFSATIFVVTGRIGQSSVWDLKLGFPDRPLMRAQDIEHWSRLGFEFGAHTHTHPDLCSLSDAEVECELESSRAALGAIIGARVTSFAYPFGRYDTRVCALVGRIFDVSFTCDPGLNDSAVDPCRVRRTVVNPARWIRFLLHIRFRHRTG